MPIVPLKCPNCGANLTVDSDKDAAICQHCGTPYVVKDAIVKYYVSNYININADAVNVYSERDFVIKGGVLEKYNGEAVDVVIPDNVKRIGDRAFAGLEIESVTIPDSVTKIDSSAFEDCHSLTNLTMGNGVENIGGQAFWCCDRLINIAIPNSVTSIGCQAFRGCTNLTSITIPDSVASISDHAFEGCTSLTRINISDLTKWYNLEPNNLGCSYNLYLNGEMVTEIVLSDSGTGLRECTSLTNITIPDGITSIDWGTFYGCTGLTNIEIPNSVTSIGKYAFNNCTGLTNIEIPNSVTSIGEYAFKNCTGLTSIVIPSGVKNIEGFAFSGCKNLKNVVISNPSAGLIMSFKDTPWFDKYTEENNLCRHCGNRFKGIISKTCSVCGKQKDY